MALQAPIPSYSPEEYLSLERDAAVKNEYLDGEIFAMAGASREHSLIAANLVRELGTQLKTRPCEVHGSDLRVNVADSGLYTYPDVSVVCGQPAFQDTQQDTLLNPTVIFEVLSPTTEAYDRGEKFARYRRLPSLQEYVLVAQDRPRLERFQRQGAAWVFTEASGLEAIMDLPAVGCRLALAEVYDKVVFETDQEQA